MRNALVIAASILLVFGRSLHAEDAASNTTAVSFLSFDLWIDGGEDALAAYQVEVTYDAKRVRIVGLEGGEHEAYRDAPYFDRTGFTGGRIVVAAFISRDDDAPGGRTRVARIHVAVERDGAPDLGVRLVTAAKPGGERITPAVKLRKTSLQKEAQGEGE